MRAERDDIRDESCNEYGWVYQKMSFNGRYIQWSMVLFYLIILRYLI